MGNRVFLLALAIALTLMLAACKQATPPPPVEGKPLDPQVVAAAFQKGGCGACHVIPGIPNAAGTIGPDLSKIGETAGATLQDKAYTGKAKDVAGYIHEAIVEPDAYAQQGLPRRELPERADAGHAGEGVERRGVGRGRAVTWPGCRAARLRLSPAASIDNHDRRGRACAHRDRVRRRQDRSSSSGARAATARCARAPPAPR